jgi:Branched-chain amino acid transport protein (AzlD).
MNERRIFVSIFVMAIVTYFSRVTTMVLFRKKMKNRFLCSFINYTPFGVLAVLVVPNIFYSTGGILSGIIGSLTALLLAYFKKGLLLVSLGATLAVFVTERLITLLS